HRALIFGVSDHCCYALLDRRMNDLFYDIEMPLIVCLYDMEILGIRLLPDKLRAYGDTLGAQIKDIEHSIHEEAGEEFNINSPMQLGEILFGKMGIPGGKKTKKGYSTAADVLEKLAPDYPFVSRILEYRALTKLKSTYTDGLQQYLDADGRIHSTFNQTITATGRISSTEPNLQNIPARMEQGRLIRKYFVPKDGCMFVDADYSQIELRVMAHLSGDETLIEAFRTGADIHSITASKVFHVAPGEVTSLMRRNAKAVNFGIIYGISAFGLASDLNIAKKEAQDFIDEYFRTFPKVKAFIDAGVEKARKDGYVTTVFGRRRPLPELSSSDFMKRSFGERVAMNAPIQGTAADIMKIAMIKVKERLEKEGLESRVILQVHDELLIEAPESEVEKAAALLKEEMENAVSFTVPMSVETSTGSNWYEAK
ncbi:MAG: DNA polymerase I, partial [Lachnospiraceae bacterium]|nr:DNA polymerase I [Lachnospiraceae bacterium]